MERQNIYSIMINLHHLKRLIDLYPQGTLENPTFALAGGTAVLCLLHHHKNKRNHHDIDIFSFENNIYPENIDDSPLDKYFFVGSFASKGILRNNDQSSVPLQVIRRLYFDSEVTPSRSDVCLVKIKTSKFLTLSPEFIIISKLSYPYPHRLCDFRDVLSLIQSRDDIDFEYLSALLKQTSLGSIIKPQEILELKSESDLQNLIDNIHYKIINRFLYLDHLNVEVLNPFQLFVLLDIDVNTLNLQPVTLSFINTSLSQVSLNQRHLGIANLGLHLLLAELYDYNEVLMYPDFDLVIGQGLSLCQKCPTLWLLLAKDFFSILRTLNRLDKSAGIDSCTITPATIVMIGKLIFQNQVPRFALRAALQVLLSNVENGIYSSRQCINSFENLLKCSLQQENKLKHGN